MQFDGSNVISLDFLDNDNEKGLIDQQEDVINVKNFTEDDLLVDYFEAWIDLYKVGAVRQPTIDKYHMSVKWLRRIAPKLMLKDLNRSNYQKILNAYGLYHEKVTTTDFHHQLKSMILDAVDDGLVPKDPTRKAICKGKTPRKKRKKYLNQYEMHNLLEDLKLDEGINWDWLILLIAKTGMRFSEAVGVTPQDFDFVSSTVSINKTWDYKNGGGFVPTKNKSSVRTIPIDWKLAMQMQQLVADLPKDQPIFGTSKTHDSTPNHWLHRHCRNIGAPEISIHGLRHTHASLLFAAGVSLASVSKRLGHSSTQTTQKVYLHLINELENKDNDIVMRYMSGLD